MLRSTTAFIELPGDGTDTIAQTRRLLAKYDDDIKRVERAAQAYAKNRRQALDGISDEALRRSAER